VFHVAPRGGLGSRMMQLLVALKFRKFMPGCEISGAELPEWDVSHPAIEGGEDAAEACGGDRIDLAGLAERARRGDVRRIAFSGLGRRLENLPDAAACREVFRSPFPGRLGFGEGDLVCHVGAGGHPFAPAAFYADLAEETGLRLVFMGRTAPNPYTDRLRARFPEAMFVEPRDPALDFETIRQSRNVVVGVSVFAWLAAFLSAEARVFMTVRGCFNPMQSRDVFLLPLQDPRYRFYLFPIVHAAAAEDQSGLWRRMPSPILARLLAEAPRFERTLDAMAARFDAAFYLAQNPDVAGALGAENFDGARVHYADFGFSERRAPFPLDEAWYSARYPMAALEVGQGDYADFAHHYVAVGRERGYRPTP
jgi:hypothetical protein